MNLMYCFILSYSLFTPISILIYFLYISTYCSSILFTLFYSLIIPLSLYYIYLLVFSLYCLSTPLLYACMNSKSLVNYCCLLSIFYLFFYLYSFIQLLPTYNQLLPLHNQLLTHNMFLLSILYSLSSQLLFYSISSILIFLIVI